MDEYILKVLNMMCKASAKNAMNIVTKVVDSKDAPAEYPFEDFLNGVYRMLPHSQLSGKMQLSICALTNRTINKLHDGKNYNVQMLADDYILSLWGLIWNRAI